MANPLGVDPVEQVADHLDSHPDVPSPVAAAVNDLEGAETAHHGGYGGYGGGFGYGGGYFGGGGFGGGYGRGGYGGHHHHHHRK